MDKILTISIAAYNVEDYIEQAISSCISKNSIDEIEILVMNDGSKDSTSQKAQKYADMYPGSVKVVNKENGGYGTNITVALEIAKGKYFKLLDGDDFLDEGSIDKLVELLKGKDNDLIVTDIFYYFQAEDRKAHRPCSWEKFNGKSFDVNDSSTKLPISMWYITVKTEALRKTYKPLPSHTLYTDQLFLYYAFMGSKTIYFSELSTYCYRIGREGQSIEKKQRMKHWEDSCIVFDYLLDDYSNIAKTNPLMDRRIEMAYGNLVRTFLLFKPEKKWKDKIKEYDQKVKTKSHRLYKNTWWNYKRITLLRLTGFTTYRFMSGKGGWF